ncbi:Os06g0661100, partial [Oryza sativa Japonica Group]
ARGRGDARDDARAALAHTARHGNGRESLRGSRDGTRRPGDLIANPTQPATPTRTLPARAPAAGWLAAHVRGHPRSRVVDRQGARGANTGHAVIAGIKQNTCLIRLFYRFRLRYIFYHGFHFV